MVNCFVKTFRAEGLPAFYSGFIPNFARLGSWNAAMFVTAEYVSPHSFTHSLAVHPRIQELHGTELPAVLLSCLLPPVSGATC